MDPAGSSLAHDGARLLVELDFAPEAVPKARSIVRARAAAVPPLVVADAELLTSEVVSNAVRHGAPPLHLAVTAGKHDLTIEVTDGSSVVPQLPSGEPDPDAGGGRGLRIVHLLASAWGVDPGDSGKTVWFRVSAGDRGGRPASRQEEHSGKEETWT